MNYQKEGIILDEALSVLEKSSGGLFSNKKEKT